MPKRIEAALHGSKSTLPRGTGRRSRSVFASLLVIVGALLLMPAGGSAAGTGSISGNVTSATGHAAIEGVEACALSAGSHEMKGCEGTGADGSYTISGLAAGSYDIEFLAYGGLNYLTQYYNGKATLDAADTVSVVEGATTSNIDAELHAGGKVEGTVVDAGSKAPISNVEVCVYRGSDGQFSRCTQTESEGKYALAGLATGSYAVKFKPDYNDHVHAKQFYDGKATREAASPVSVTAGATMQNIDAELQEGGKVTGTVTKATGGAAIESVYACATPTHYEPGEYNSNCGFTDATGKYTISGLAEGSYKIQFSGGLNYLSQFYDNVTSESEVTVVSVSLGTTTPNIDAKLQAAGQIKGKIVDAVSKAPLNGVEACAFKPESSFSQNICGYVSNGEYTIGGLPSGSYKVRFTAGYGEIAPGEYGQLNYATQFYNGKATEAEAEPVSVTAGSATANIDAEMHVGGKIAGKVVSASGKAAVKGAEVCASPVSKRASPGGCAQTNAAGEYTIPRLATGSYRVRFRAGYEHPEYLVQFYSGRERRGESDPVSVTAGATTANVDAELQEGGKVSGTVIDASSKVPLKEIGVCVRAFCATTNAAGEYTIQGIPTGFYKVRFAPGYATNRNYITQYYNEKPTFEAANEIAVTAGATTPNIDAELHQGGKVKGTVVDATTKAPIQYVEVCALRSGSEEYEYTGCARTDASGAYAIEGLSGGSYKIGFYVYGYEGGGAANLNYLTQYYSGAASLESAAVVAVTPGSTSTGIDAELHEGGRISGTVTGAPSAAPIRYAEACAVKVGGSEEEYGECARTDASGHYTIEGLSSGSYTVRFSSFVPGLEAQNNYLTRYYDEKGPGEAADPVSVTVGSTATGIDAELQVGGQVKGKVVAASNGVPLREVSVCAIAVSVGEEEFGSCAQTNGSGEYTISGLASGSYKIKFSALNYEYEEGIPFGEGEVTPEEEFTTQFYSGKPTLAQAAPVSVTAGSATGEINASMVEATPAPSKPVNTEAPVLSGAPVPGEALSCSHGLWSGNPTGYTYRWLRDGSEISGTGGGAYTVQGADQGHAISCRVTASNGKGSTSATSNAVQVAAEGGGGTQYGLVVSLAGTGSGTVTSSPGGIGCSPGCSHDYAAGTSVVLTATPASGSSFVGWSGACSGTGACHVTLNAATSVTASFNAEAGGGSSGGGGGSPSGGGGGAPAGGGTTGSAPPVPAPAPAAKPKTLKCKKGFRKSTVKGKTKCVKVKHHSAHKRSRP
jgi:5-hydroxyisourate hydrolase-like protein (transthyretin family)